MKDQFKLEIAEPCSENFYEFTPTDTGGFCDSCSKNVVDFTTMSSTEIYNYFKNDTRAETCGRFHTSQLKAYHNPIVKRQRFSLFGGLALALMAGLTSQVAEAQQPTPQTEIRSQISKVETMTTQQKDFTVKGVVLDESNLPLPGVNIVLQGTALGTQTNFDGEFEFPELLKVGDVLVISYVGYDTQRIEIKNENSASEVSLKLDMTNDHTILMGKVAVKKVHKSKKSFWK